MNECIDRNDMIGTLFVECNLDFVQNSAFEFLLKYKINCTKLKKLGWKPKRNLKDDIPFICEWYKKNSKIFR